MISVAHLTKKYHGVTAVDDVSFDVDAGEIVGFLGPNGAGKTTIMRILSGFFAATGGEVRVAGHDVLTDSLAVRRSVGYLPEMVPLYPDLRVDEYLRYRARLKGLTYQRVRSRLAEVKDQMGLNDVGRTLIGYLSRGFRQRVGLADALIHEPPLLILDEPTVGLDPKQNSEIRTLITSLSPKHTVLLSSHILPEVELTCQRVLILNAGRMIASDTPDGLKKVMRGGRRLLAQIRGAPSQVKPVLEGLPQVRSVTVLSGGEWTEYVVESPREMDLRSNLFEAIVRQGWSLRELRVLEDTLEDIYLGLTDKTGRGWPT